MTRSHSSPIRPAIPSAPWRTVWSVVGRPALRQWWLPASLRPALLRAFGAAIDDRVVIRESVDVLRPWQLRIEGPAWIAHGVSIDHGGDVTVERDASLGRGVVLGSTFPGNTAPIVLRRGAWVAAEARVDGGCEVGEYAVIGAGAEVRGLVEPGAIKRRADPGVAEDAVATL